MGRDSYKRHHPTKESTQIDPYLERQTDSNAVDLLQTNPEETKWVDPEPTASTTRVENPPPTTADESTLPGIAGRFLSGNLTIIPKNFIFFTVCCYIIFVCILYLQDNNLGKLDTMGGIKIFGMKLLPITGLLLIIVIIVVLINLFSKKQRQTNK